MLVWVKMALLQGKKSIGVAKIDGEDVYGYFLFLYLLLFFSAVIE